MSEEEPQAVAALTIVEVDGFEQTLSSCGETVARIYICPAIMILRSLRPFTQLYCCFVAYGWSRKAVKDLLLFRHTTLQRLDMKSTHCSAAYFRASVTYAD